MRFSLLIDREEGFLHSGGHLSLLIQSVCICQVEIAGCEIFGENIGLIALQEEITQKTLALCVEASKMTAQLLQQAMKKVLADMEKHKNDPQLHHGKQTIRQLMKHGAGVSNIEITDQNIKAFSATAKKYGIDFALKKDTTGEIPRYLVFFKGRDADAVTAAFREFSAKNLAKEKKPSIRRRLTKAKEQAKRQELERGEKVKNRDRGLER